MSSPTAQISVWTEKQFACVKIQGCANFTSSIDFNALVTGLRERGFSYFVIELSDCTLMDSTFLGVLAGFGLKMTQANGRPAGHRVELRNPNTRIEELLENIGVLHLFTLTNGNLAAPENLAACTQQTTTATREELTRTCLEAHQFLMTLNQENATRFKDVTRFLAEDLAKLQAQPTRPTS